MTDDDKRFVEEWRVDEIEQLRQRIRELEAEVSELRASRKKLAEINDEKHRDLSWQTHFRKEAQDEANALQANNAKLRAALEKAKGDVIAIVGGVESSTVQDIEIELEDGCSTIKR